MSEYQASHPELAEPPSVTHTARLPTTAVNCKTTHNERGATDLPDQPPPTVPTYFPDGNEGPNLDTSAQQLYSLLERTTVPKDTF